MPLDPALFRQSEEGGIIGEVERWQELRFSNQKDINSNIKLLIHKINKAESRRREILKDESHKRTLINRYQKQLAPKKKVTNVADEKYQEKSEDDLKDALSKLKKILPTISAELADSTQNLEEMITRIPNVVDESLFEYDFEDFFQRRCQKISPVPSDTLKDPLFCLCGSETIVVPNFNQVKKKVLDETLVNIRGKTFLIGDGLKIWSSMMAYGRDYFHSIDSFQECIRLPEFYPLSTTDAHCIYGCKAGLSETPSTCSFCGEKYLHNVPAYVSLLQANKNEIFSNKMLPFVQPYQTDQQSNQLSKFAHSMEKLEVFALSVSSIFASRQLQDEIVTHIVSFYKSLLCKTEDLINDNVSLISSDEEDPIQIQVLDPSDLQFHECRRIVIKGYLPSTKSFVCLASVSNSSDYVSRHFKIKCSGKTNNLCNEYTHMIHGTILHEDALQWMLEHNLSVAKCQSGDKSMDFQGVTIPSVLTHHCNLNGSKVENAVIWLPFQRTISKAKSGKMKVKAFKHIPESIVASLKSKVENNSSASKNHSFEGSLVKSENLTGNVNIEGAKLEAMCNPYEFLPLYK